MPQVHWLFYQEEDGRAPMVEWMRSLPSKVAEKCRARLILLHSLGNELHRPYADYLREGIYELRFSYLGIQYRMLYFFHGRTATVVSHGLVKEQKVPPMEIEKAIERKKNFFLNPAKHSFEVDLS